MGADFGVSSFLASTAANASTFCGTMRYLSPERMKNDMYSFPADIWAIGLVVLELAQGSNAYQSTQSFYEQMRRVTQDPSPQLSADEYGQELADFCAWCLEKDPSARPTIDQVLDCDWLVDFEEEYDADPAAAH